MSGKKKTFIIILCVIIVVAAIVAPTSALYFQEHSLEGMISSRSFDIANSHTDNFNVNLTAGETKSFGFFATTSATGKNVLVTVDNSALQETDISLWVKVGDTESEITTKDSNGSFVDYNSFSSLEEKRLYFVKVHANSDIKVNGVTVLIGASSEKPRDPSLPDHAEDIELPVNDNNKSEIEITEDLALPSADGFFLNTVNYVMRKDDYRYISAIGKTQDDKEVLVTPTFEGNVLKLAFAKIDGVEYVADKGKIPVNVTIYLPSTKPIDKVVVTVTEETEYSGIIANVIDVKMPNGNKEIEINDFSCNELHLDASSKDIEIGNLTGIANADIELVKIITTDNGTGEISIDTKSAIKNLVVESGKDIELTAKTVYNATINMTKNNGILELELKEFASKIVGKPSRNDFGTDEFSQYTFEIISGDVRIIK